MQVNNGIPNNTDLNVLEVYDIASGTWSTGPNMIDGRWGHKAIAYNGKIYVFGGNLPVYYSTVEVYDPQANSWTLLNTLMPTGRYQFAACLLDNKIYTIDGWYHSGNGPIYDKVEVYDPIDNVWTTETPMPVAVGVSDGFTMNGKIYVFGGSYTTHPLIGISDIYEFTPPIVPVELISFTATSSGSEVILNWSTATELNNQGFEIERSKDNINFDKIGFVPGFGTTTEPKSYSYTDSEVSKGKYVYRLKQIDFDGLYTYSDEVNVEVGIPLEFALEQNYPNPFNPSTTIRYSVPQNSMVNIKVYNIVGQEVAELVNEAKPSGKYEINFEANELSSGIYLVKMHSTDFTSTIKMTLLK